MTDVQRQIEQEIVEKFWSLDPAARRRVLDQLSLIPQQSTSEWLEEARKLREEMRKKYGQLPFSLSDIVHETREERLDDILDNR
jgi:hypothetical protein